MPRLPEEKVVLYKRLTSELEEVDNDYHRLKDIVKSNHKSIRDLRDDISRWKETCWRQSDHIHKLYLVSAIQFLTITGLAIWTVTLLIFH